MSESEFEQIREITDLYDRAKAVLDAQDRHRQAISTLSAMRREILTEIRASGDRPAEMAKRLGITSARMSQLLAAPGPGPERAFLGDGRLTVVVGEKYVNGNHNAENLGVALETMGAYDRLKELAQAYQLDADKETVSPPGLFDLNRNNLVVMSGPRLFPLVRQILAGDPNINFEVDEGGEWTLRDVETGKSYETVEHVTKDVRRDFGYLGRLPRPDGRGTFLCMAGIHATGTQGVVAYLEQNLAQLYDEVKTRKFSMVIESEYDFSRKTTTTAKQTSPIYRWS